MRSFSSDPNLIALAELFCDTNLSNDKVSQQEGGEGKGGEGKGGKGGKEGRREDVRAIGKQEGGVRA